MGEPAAEVGRYLRKWARTSVNLRADVEIVTPGGRRLNSGTAVVRDVSLKGARLGRLRLRRPSLPLRAFRIRLGFRSEKYRGIGALCRPVRFGRGPEFELAVEFEDLWARAP